MEREGNTSRDGETGGQRPDMSGDLQRLIPHFPPMNLPPSLPGRHMAVADAGASQSVRQQTFQVSANGGFLPESGRARSPSVELPDQTPDLPGVCGEAGNVSWVGMESWLEEWRSACLTERVGPAADALMSQRSSGRSCHHGKNLSREAALLYVGRGDRAALHLPKVAAARHGRFLPTKRPISHQR